MRYKTLKERRLARQEIIDAFIKMTKEELLKYIDENLWFNEDFGADEWVIYIEDLIIKIHKEIY